MDLKFEVANKNLVLVTTLLQSEDSWLVIELWVPAKYNNKRIAAVARIADSRGKKCNHLWRVVIFFYFYFSFSVLIGHLYMEGGLQFSSPSSNSCLSKALFSHFFMFFKNRSFIFSNSRHCNLITCKKFLLSLQKTRGYGDSWNKILQRFEVEASITDTVRVCICLGATAGDFYFFLQKRNEF